MTSLKSSRAQEHWELCIGSELIGFLKIFVLFTVSNYFGIDFIDSCLIQLRNIYLGKILKINRKFFFQKFQKMAIQKN